MAARPRVAELRAQGLLRPFEHGVHLDVLEHTLDTARQSFQRAGVEQVRQLAAQASAAALRGAGQPTDDTELATMLAMELARLWALGYRTVQSELTHQRSGARLPIGLSSAPAPPNLRQATGDARRCATCEMFDNGVCWGYGNYPVEPELVCDSYSKAIQVSLDSRIQGSLDSRQLAVDPGDDPEGLARRAELAAQHVVHVIWQAAMRALLLGKTNPADVTAAAEIAGDAALRQAALAHAGGILNQGRTAAATVHADEIVGARYTAVLDRNTCTACALADDGVLRALDDPVRLARRPPNPACAGGDYCRCVEVYELASETPAADEAVGPRVRSAV